MDQMSDAVLLPAFQAVAEFLAAPSVVFQKPDALRAVLCCMPLRELQMVLAYVVRQHCDVVSRADDGGSSSGGGGAGVRVAGYA